MKEEIVATIKANQVTVISGMAINNSFNSRNTQPLIFSQSINYSFFKQVTQVSGSRQQCYLPQRTLFFTIHRLPYTTGCGKTTQVPQLVLDDMITNGCGAEAHMVVTQPRRISAIGVANRIADERCEQVGETAGYSIRLENKRSSKTRLLLCTTGILLRRLQCDPDLASVSHVFVDEVHERDLNTDFLLIVLKDLLARRKSLKLVLMSATLNASAFSDFFGGCPVVTIPGRAFPVKENRLEDILQMTGYEVPEDSDYALKVNESRPARFSKSALRNMYYPKYSLSTIASLSIVNESVINYELIAELVEHICLNNEEGAILIFLPGIGEITKAIEELYKKELFQSSKTVIHPLHSSLSTAEQTAIFEVPPEGVRKIVVATNIAETSITIEGKCRHGPSCHTLVTFVCRLRLVVLSFVIRRRVRRG
jgi:ATP-dependent RNA helicase DHX36